MALSNYEVGLLGEQVVQDYFKRLGYSISTAGHKYDQEKDFLVNGVKTEVKTQSLYRSFCFPDRKGYAFTIPIASDTKIHRNQLSKCLNVERLIFVQKSSASDPRVRLYAAPPVGQRFFCVVQNTKDMRFVAGFPIESMKLIYTITKDDIVSKLMDNWR
jgi:hypothetical protein